MLPLRRNFDGFNVAMSACLAAIATLIVVFYVTKPERDANETACKNKNGRWVQISGAGFVCLRNDAVIEIDTKKPAISR